VDLAAPPPAAWFAAFLLTVAVEVPIVVALTRVLPVRAGRRAALAVCAQLLTHPLVWFVFPRLAGLTGYQAMALSELWAWLAEAAFYLLVLPGLGPARALGVSAIANGASIVAGIVWHALAR
jgi:hypothetical protein